MQKNVTKIKQQEESMYNLKYWSTKSSDEKLDAVQRLREQYITLFNKQAEYDETRKRLRRFYKVINNHKVEYMIVGAYALALYAEPRNTGDIDIFINRTDENVDSILKALADFGFEALDLTK